MVRLRAPASVSSSSKLKFCFPRSRSDTPACVGEPEQILQARMYRYVILLQDWGLQIAPDGLTHAAPWTALAAA